ncbi:MAG: hypothetical protein ACM3NI_11660 [Bacteroidota bacterium]
MATKRTPIRRPPRGGNFSPKALEALREMQRLEDACTCPPRNWDRDQYWKFEPCSACNEWWDHHSILHHELALKPWQWPCVEHPDAASPYPAGSYADQHWQPDLEAQQLYKALEAALEKVSAT